MKLEKAIEILRSAIAYQDWPELTELNQAQQLGLEALKAYLDLRECQILDVDDLLPGETKE